jgi:hypothetical protein
LFSNAMRKAASASAAKRVTVWESTLIFCKLQFEYKNMINHAEIKICKI